MSNQKDLSKAQVDQAKENNKIMKNKAVIIMADNTIKVKTISDPFDQNLGLELGGELSYRSLDRGFAGYPNLIAGCKFGYEDGLDFNYVASFVSGRLYFGDAAIIKDSPDNEFPIECFIMSAEEASEFAKEARKIAKRPLEYRKQEMEIYEKLIAKRFGINFAA